MGSETAKFFLEEIDWWKELKQYVKNRTMDFNKKTNVLRIRSFNPFTYSKRDRSLRHRSYSKFKVIIIILTPLLQLLLFSVVYH